MNEFQNAGCSTAAQLFSPQGIFGSLLGAPPGGLIGHAIGGLFGSASLGTQISQTAGGLGAGLLPFGADPFAAARQAQQLQMQQEQYLHQLNQLHILTQLAQLEQQLLAQVPQQQISPGQFTPQSVLGSGPVERSQGKWKWPLLNTVFNAQKPTGLEDVGKVFPFSAPPFLT